MLQLLLLLNTANFDMTPSQKHGAEKETTEIAVTIFLKWIIMPSRASKVGYFEEVPYLGEADLFLSSRSLKCWSWSKYSKNLHVTWEHAVFFQALSSESCSLERTPQSF